MNRNAGSSPANEIHFSPQSGACYNFIQDQRASRKTIWLVPHVIKHRAESAVITWRCNWGNVCEAECLYALAKEKAPLLAEALSSG